MTFVRTSKGATKMKYDFDKVTDRVGTNCYKWDLAKEGELPMWVADMDFEVPPAVIDRVEKRLKHKVFGYTRPGNEIFRCLTDWFADRYSVDVPKEWIRLISGIVPALCVASNIGGGASMTCVPNYSSLLTAPKNAGNKMITVPMDHENEYYTFDFDKMQAALTPDTKIFYLCSPLNPAGRVFTLDELKAVSEFARKNELIVISDEAHCEVVFEGKHIPFFTVDDYARENSITLYSNGKMCNVADLILAFAVIPNRKLREEFMRQGYAFGMEHALNIEAGIASYGESDEWKEQLLTYLEGNRDYLETELRNRFPKAKLPHLEATYLQWVDFTPYGEHINAAFLRNHAKVFLTDGADFGDPRYVRINFGTQRANIREMLDRVEKAVFDSGDASGPEKY